MVKSSEQQTQTREQTAQTKSACIPDNGHLHSDFLIRFVAMFATSPVVVVLPLPVISTITRLVPKVGVILNDTS